MLEEVSDDENNQTQNQGQSIWDNDDGEEEDNGESEGPSYAEHNFHAGQHDIVYQNKFTHWKSPT